MILQLLNVVIGLTLIYLIFSTIASVLFDLIESLLKRRGKLLARGLKEIFRKLSDNPDQDIRRFYEHPLISALFEGDFQENGRKLPSYIQPERFASVVRMLAEDARSNAATSGNDAFVRLVEYGNRLIEQSKLDAEEPKTLESVLVDHFEDSMDRVSGWFARYTRGVLFLIGFALAAAANVDTVQIVQTLSMDPVLADRVAETAGQYVEQRTAEAASAEKSSAEADDASHGDLASELKLLRENRALAESLGIPLGWRSDELIPLLDQGWLATKKLVGLFLTALSLSFGATFWFDMVNRLISLRTTIKPSLAKNQVEESDAEADSKETVTVGQVIGSAERVVHGAGA